MGSQNPSGVSLIKLIIWLSRKLFRFTCQECVAEYLEAPGVFFPSGFSESIVRLANLNIDESSFSEHRLPAFTRKAAGDSRRP